MSAPTAASPAAASTAPLDAEEARGLLKALADPVRLSVIQALGEGELCVCDLTARLGLAQSRLSFHLRVLRQAGLLSDRHQGRWVYYRLQPEAIARLRRWLADVAAGSDAAAPDCD
jgi:ArsR family transcriptional regulator